MKKLNLPQNAVALFWISQVLGLLTALVMTMIVWGSLISELTGDEMDMNIRDNTSVFILGIIEILAVAGIILSWFKRLAGGILWLASALALSIVWTSEHINFLYFHLPLVISAILFLLYLYLNRNRTEAGV